ncbi:DUF72 domain-containing protein [Sphingomonas sp. EC-HK361]|uniref:DUF72 domain-containing protein n=1 Tax=Sphingomonas sp. EC-HK361 TaxID=2038397 RepID=UPI00125EDBB0|nr:DUF72 domain-containing protein [Sphingomonas sp. EC-HK361]
MTNAPIRIGIGGWTFEPWRGPFYPPKWPIKRELEYAASKLTAIEVNGTYYSGLKPQTFANWRESVPDGFVFTLKASRFCTNRKVLAEGGESIARFVGQGIVELGDRLGPILWQFMATKRFDADDFRAFLALLPKSEAGVALRHAVQVRHESFAVPEFVAMCREAGVAIVYAQSDAYPAIADMTADFVYARIETAVEDEPLGYSDKDLDRWAASTRAWARGEQPAGLPYVGGETPAKTARETFLFFIAGAKVRNPLAAQALIARLG